MTKQIKHITVCICTYKRPVLLKQLLLKLEQQETNGLFNYSVVIVDNDAAESARNEVKSFAKQSSLAISYNVEPEQNIALARNKAVENARGDYIAFIDDDEFPSRYWLLRLFEALRKYKCDGILGPVLPHFEEQPPKWVVKGRFFERPNHSTGHLLAWKNTRTGNALLLREVFDKNNGWFNPSLGSGGEDREFFRRKIDEGFCFIWCAEAIVHESVPAVRCKRSFMLRRALLRGQLPRFKPLDYMKSITAIPLYALILPVLIVTDHSIFMRYLIKECDHLGRLLSLFGVNLIKERYVLE